MSTAPRPLGEFSRGELLRYSRHLLLPEVGPEGQARLKGARVLVAGAGGLGSPMALYLAAAGVGTIGIADFDSVDLSNIQRQILFTTSDVGRPKVDAAVEHLRSLNPDVTIVPHPERIGASNILRIAGDYDIVADGTDNFTTRYLLNDACVLLQKPNVHGSIFRFEGQLSVFAAPGGPCYRCVFPEPPPPGAVPSCAEAGVLGVLPGIVGTLQALEVLKLVLGIGETLAGRLLLIDALPVRFQELTIRRDPTCPVCGENPTITAPVEMEIACERPAEETPATGRHAAGASMSVEDLHAAIEKGAPIFLLDVREPYEAAIAKIPGGHLIPLGEVPQRLREVDRKRTIVVYCHHGIRSSYACSFLRDAGFEDVRNLSGGIDAWSARVDGSVPRY